MPNLKIPSYTTLLPARLCKSFISPRNKSPPSSLPPSMDEEELHLTDSTLGIATTTDLERAWHLLSLLLRIGRPISLSSLSLLFPAEPNYVTHLCSIPNSPIFLTSELLVAPSLVAFNAFRKFLLDCNGYTPRIELRLFPNRSIWEGAGRMYHRKRKMFRLELESEPFPKKRPIMHQLDENEENQIVVRADSSNFTKALLPGGNKMTGGFREHARTLSLPTENMYRIVLRDPSSRNPMAEQLGNETQNADLDSCKESGFPGYTWEHEHLDTSKCPSSFLSLRSSLDTPNLIKVQNIKEHNNYSQHNMQTTPVQESTAWRETKVGNTSFEQKVRFSAITCMELEQQIVTPLEAYNVSHAYKFDNSKVVEDNTVDMNKKENKLFETTIGKTFKAISCMEVEEQSRVLPVECEKASHACKANNAEVVEDGAVNSCKREKSLVNVLQHERECTDPALDNGDTRFLHDADGINLCVNLLTCQGGDTTTARLQSKDGLANCKPSFHHNQPSKASATVNDSKRDAINHGKQARCDIPGDNWKNSSPSGEMQCTRDKLTIFKDKKVKQSREGSTLCRKGHDELKKEQENPIATTQKNQPGSKPLPSFELYNIEEEEGSGGYGTVYRARRKTDGITFAIKCPHENANSHHVDNELKMLERFGGKNSVIKYEGSFKSDGSKCLVLEHVHHDRPEILKKEIEVAQLRWYSYCMFRALAALHKQGIVHRDIKPGNFLFSRKVNQGFLIDFNLAMDLHQKYGTSGDKSKVRHNVSSNNVLFAQVKTTPLANKKFMTNKPMESTSKVGVKVSISQNLLKAQKKNVLGQKKTFSSQVPDGSGVTSVKDATSSRIPSGEMSKEPILVQGRKALVTFAHETRQSPNYETHIVPATKRKRVSASPRKVDKEHVCLTPMPLFCNGREVAGSGRIKDNEGDRKQKRDGPCVGTKGFRAPEVLFRSAHQGHKIDVWSAGVTLLYLVIGRTPFTGEPEQNIIDIAKLRGSEDLWEVAKLHNRVSSFPSELHDVKFLSPVKLKDWCKQNTRRLDFFNIIPMSLLDLVDKCLTVNPRLRLSAEEALKHEFFTECHVELRKLRQQTR